MVFHRWSSVYAKKKIIAIKFMDTVQVESNVLVAIQSRGVGNRAVVADSLLVVRPGLKCGSNLKPFTLIPEWIKVALQSNFSLQTSESNGIQ